MKRFRPRNRRWRGDKRKEKEKAVENIHPCGGNRSLTRDERKDGS
jgi:hypothetical protein